MSTEPDLPEPTLNPKLNVQIRGWGTEDEDGARGFGGKLWAFAHEWSRYLDLSLLDEVVVAWDYATALAEASGAETREAAAPTRNEFGTGHAMALVLPDGAGGIRSKVVVSTFLIERMFDEDDSLEKRLSRQTFLHELVHVDDQAFLAKTYPGGPLAAQALDPRHSALLRISDGAHNEYSATKRTASVEPTVGIDFIDMLEKVLLEAEEEVLDRRKKYQRGQIDLDEFWLWAQERSRFIFQALGYALGHFDGVLGLEEVPEDLLERLRAKMAAVEGMPLGWLVQDTREAVEPIMRQEAWTGLEVLDPLLDVADRLLQEFGVHLSNDGDNLYISIPFRGIIDL